MRQQGKEKILPEKMQVRLQENKKMKTKQKRPKSKWPRNTNPVKAVRRGSTESLRPNCEYCIRYSLTD